MTIIEKKLVKKWVVYFLRHKTAFICVEDSEAGATRTYMLMKTRYDEWQYGSARTLSDTINAQTTCSRDELHVKLKEIYSIHKVEVKEKRKQQEQLKKEQLKKEQLERRREYKRAYKRAYRARIRTEEQRLTQRAKNREIKRRWRQNNRASYVADRLSRKRNVRTQTPTWAKSTTLDTIRALKRRYPDGSAWHLDHVVPLSGKAGNIHVVCGLHVWYNLQVIPAKDNLTKGCHTWNDMPEYTREDLDELAVHNNQHKTTERHAPANSRCG